MKHPETERQVTFTCRGSRLYGILSSPPSDTGRGVVFLHGWAGQRTGPHRIFVQMARRLAEEGVSSLRFDFRGRGDSEGDADEASLTTMIEDAAEAVKCLLENDPRVRTITLLGLCSGGEAAIGASSLNPAVKSLALWSVPLVGGNTERTEIAKTGSALRSYFAKLGNAGTWRRLLSGRIHGRLVMRALFGHWRRQTAGASRAQEQKTLLESFLAFRSRVLFVHGSLDPGAAAVQEEYRLLCQDGKREAAFHLVEGANHNFYSMAWKRELFELTARWMS